MPLEFTKEQTYEQVEAFRAIMNRRFNLDADEMDAEMALKDLANTVVVHAYNKGVEDAQAYLAAKLTDLGIDVYLEPEPAETTDKQVRRKPDRR